MLEKKIQILEEVLGSFDETRQRQRKEFLFGCPKCRHHKKKLSVNLTKDRFKCWVCLWAGNSVYWIIFQYGDGSQVARWNESNGVDFAELRHAQSEEEKKITLPEEFISIASHKLSPSTQAARLYLKNRGVSFQDICWWKLGVCLEGKYKNRIIVPSFGNDGKLNYFVARTYDRHPIPYMNPPMNKDLIFNSLFIDWTKDIVITEGVFDAIVAGNSLPLLGSTLQEGTVLFQEIVSKCPKIFLALDPDAESKERAIIKEFLMYGTEVWKINVKPFKDVGEMSKEEFQKHKEQAIEMTISNELELALLQ